MILHRPLASSMLTPGVADIQKEFHSSSTIIASFLVSIYLLGYVFGPFVIAPMSELYGRVPVYHACNTLLLIFTIACAVAQTLPQLMAFRFLAGFAGVCPLTIGSGTVADMIYKEKRAGVMALWSMAPYLGPVIGPIAGGFLVEATNWRWVFWVLSIAVCLRLMSQTSKLFKEANHNTDGGGSCNNSPPIPGIICPRPPHKESSSTTQRDWKPGSLLEVREQ